MSEERLTYKDLLFTTQGLGVTIVHDLILGGLLLGLVCFAVEWYGIPLHVGQPSAYGDPLRVRK